MTNIALPQPQVQSADNLQPSRLTLMLRYLRRNKSLTFGLLLLLFLVAFTTIGMLTIDQDRAYALAVGSKKPPSLEYPLGTDFFGRDMLAVMVVGTWQTALIGVVAGGLATFIGVILGFISAYFGGILDTIIKGVSQILMPIPPFLIQIVIAGSLDKRDVTIYTMAFIVVLLAWMGPTVVIRSQVLSMKQREYVSVAKLSVWVISASFSRRYYLISCHLSLLNWLLRCSPLYSPHSIWRYWVLDPCVSHFLAISFGRL